MQEFVDQPGLIYIPAAPPQHPRQRLLAVLDRCRHLRGPDWFLHLQKAMRPRVGVGECPHAALLSKQLQRLAKPLASSFSRGVVVGSHSWREMGVVACYQAKFDSLWMASHGFWRDVATMWVSYIRPYKDVFPYSRFLAAVFDFLRGV
eukprot:SAG31_NODE_1697_length_7503_cov_11.474473_3_plen_148_part_00